MGFDFPKIKTMSRIIRELIQNSLHQINNREEVNIRDIGYLPDLSIVNLLSVLTSCFIVNLFSEWDGLRIGASSFDLKYHANMPIIFALNEFF